MKITATPDIVIPSWTEFRMREFPRSGNFTSARYVFLFDLRQKNLKKSHEAISFNVTGAGDRVIILPILGITLAGYVGRATVNERLFRREME
jgi:hypothetical protein